MHFQAFAVATRKLCAPALAPVLLFYATLSFHARTRASHHQPPHTTHAQILQEHLLDELNVWLMVAVVWFYSRATANLWVELALGVAALAATCMLYRYCCKPGEPGETGEEGVEGEPDGSSTGSSTGHSMLQAAAKELGGHATDGAVRAGPCQGAQKTAGADTAPVVLPMAASLQRESGTSGENDEIPLGHAPAEIK